MLGRDDDARLHLGLGQAGHHADEVNHELAIAMRNHGEVGIFTFRYFFGKLDVDGIRILRSVWIGLLGLVHVGKIKTVGVPVVFIKAANKEKAGRITPAGFFYTLNSGLVLHRFAT